MQEQPDLTTAAAPETVPPPEEAKKRCTSCGAWIPKQAAVCSTCRSWTALWEGSLPRQYFYLLFAAGSCFFGTLLPWKPLPETPVPGLATELMGIHFFSGAVICLFSLVTMLVCLWNIRSRQLLLWPILLLLIENLFFLGVHFMRAETQEAIRAAWAAAPDFRDKLWHVYRTQGIGLYFVIGGTLFILFQIVASVFSAARKGGKEKAPPARGSARRR